MQKSTREIKNEMRIPLGLSDALVALLGPSGWYTAGDEIIITNEALMVPSPLEISNSIINLQHQRDINDINEEAREYLEETDWYVTRFLEKGVAIPEYIGNLRDQARDSVKEVTTLDIVDVPQDPQSET